MFDKQCVLLMLLKQKKVLSKKGEIKKIKLITKAVSSYMKKVGRVGAHCKEKPK